MRLRAGVALVVPVLLAGCAGASSIGPSTAVAPSSSAPKPYVDNDTAAQRQAETVAYAQRILRERPVLHGESAYPGPVPKKLRRPDEIPGATNRLARSIYLTVPRSPHRVYEELRTATVPKSRLGGYGDVGAGDNGPRSAFVRFDRQVRPPTMVDGELLIEIQGRAGKPTLLAEFAQVVPHPAWPKAERIPPGSPRATVERITYSQRHRVVARRSVRLDGNESATVAMAFDNSWIAPPWVCTGGPIVLGRSTSYRVRIRSHDHTWTITTPGYCGASPVTRDSHRQLLPINASQRFERLVRRAVS